MMRKKIYLVLMILAIAGMTNVKAQMRIGGSETPNQSAVLDLNPDNNVSAGNSTLGLALPRVNLRKCNDAFPLLSHVKGMAVYNMATAGDVKPGVYINNGVKWLRQLDSSTAIVESVGKDSIVGNEVLDATVGGGLIRSGEGTEISPYTLGITMGGVTTDKIASQSVTFEKLAESAISELKEIVTDIHNQELKEWIINLILEHDQDNIIGNEVVGATDGSLKRSGNGTVESPYTLSISENGIETKHLKDGLITTEKIAYQAVTMEKLSEDVIKEFHVTHPVSPENLLPSTPNSILVSNANGQWKTQQIAGNQIICNYRWDEEHPTGWVDLGYADQTVPAGLYSAHIHINNTGSTIPIDCVVVDAGPQSTYTFPRKNSEARGQAISIESCLIYKSSEASNIRMFLHIPGTTRNGLAAIVLEPIIQLQSR